MPILIGVLYGLLIVMLGSPVLASLIETKVLVACGFGTMFPDGWCVLRATWPTLLLVLASHVLLWWLWLLVSSGRTQHSSKAPA
jgi:hypothetical protein